MKRRLFILSLTILTVFSMLNSINAQQIAINKHAEQSPHYLKEQMINESPSEVRSYSLNNINLKAIRDFTAKYKDVNNASWYRIDGGFVAKFTSEDGSTSVTYNSNGTWLHTICAGDEKKMPKDVRSLVKSTYYDYDITNVEEIRIPAEGSSIFLVHIQDATNIKVLRVCNGEMDVLHDYKRGN